MPNLSPSNSISLLTTKTKTTKEKHNNQREKRNNQTIFFSNNQTQPISKNSSSPTIKHNNRRETTKSTNARPTWGFAWIGSHRFCWSCWDQIIPDQSAGVDWIRSVVLSHFVLFHISRSPPKLTWVLLGSDRTWVLLELSFAWTTKSSPIGSSSMLKSTSSCSI